MISITFWVLFLAAAVWDAYIVLVWPSALSNPALPVSSGSNDDSSYKSLYIFFLVENGGRNRVQSHKRLILTGSRNLASEEKTSFDSSCW